MEKGPSPDEQELCLLRYAITDLADDLRDAGDALERRVIAGTLFEKTAQLMLLANGRWIGTGKHLPRRLREWNRDRAERLAAAYLADDPQGFVDVVELELNEAGGRIQAGFVR